MAERALSDEQYDNHGYLVLAGSSNAYTATLARQITGYFAGLRICGKANHTNSGASTLNINSIGDKAIRKGATTALSGGEILDDKYYDFLYDADNDVFQVVAVVPAGAITIENIAGSALSGDDTTLITGTTGTDGNLAQWDAAGNIVDGPDVLDEDDMASDSATAVPTQQSVKAYVDANASAGLILQVLQNTYTANSDLTASIPLDDTTPTISEGTQVLSQAITPASTSSRIKVDVFVWGSTSGTGGINGALFRGSTCINASTGPNLGSVSDGRSIAFSYVDSPATASSVTYSYRVGPTAGTLRLNGTTAARRYGGASACTLILTELAS